MGDSWCPIGGLCNEGGCSRDAGGQCEKHKCRLIATKALRDIRDEVRVPLEAAVQGWKARVAELEKCTAVAFAFKERMASAEARVAELESLLHEISASLVDGPDIGPKLPRAVKAELGDLHAQLDLLRAAGTFIGSMNDGLCPDEREPDQRGEVRMGRAIARLERLRFEEDEIGVSLQLKAIAELRKEIDQSGEGGS